MSSLLSSSSSSSSSRLPFGAGGSGRVVDPSDEPDVPGFELGASATVKKGGEGEKASTKESGSSSSSGKKNQTGTFTVSDPPQCAVWFEPKQWSKRYEVTFFTCSITGRVISLEDGYVYTIECKAGENVWSVQHTFADFENLVSQLQAEIKSSPSSSSSSSTSSSSSSPSLSAPSSLHIPPLPPKPWFPTFAPLEQQLQQFLAALLGQQGAAEKKSVRKFLDLDRKLLIKEEEQVGKDEDEDEGGSGGSVTAFTQLEGEGQSSN